MRCSSDYVPHCDALVSLWTSAVICALVVLCAIPVWVVVLRLVVVLNFVTFGFVWSLVIATCELRCIFFEASAKGGAYSEEVTKDGRDLLWLPPFVADSCIQSIRLGPWLGNHTNGGSPWLADCHLRECFATCGLPQVMLVLSTRQLGCMELRCSLRCAMPVQPGLE
jgi:hypothetical protein